MPARHVDVAPPGAAPYRITIAEGIAASPEPALAEARVAGRLVVVSTPPIWRAIHGRLGPTFRDAEPLLIPDGERNKHMANVARIYDGLVRTNADRATTLVAIGGGVLGDTAGFAAATFLRGLKLVQVPTTLLAQVDASVGGKVGVNHPSGKNLIGAFYQPRAVLIDPTVLETLPRREFRAGLYEVVKYAVIASPSLFTLLQGRMRDLFARDPDVLVPVLEECCAIKARIVEADEFEHGPRRILNYGHTIGHALEAITKYRRFRHGEAVGFGMLAMARLAVARAAMPRDTADAVASLIATMGPLPSVSDLSAREALAAIAHDKKVVDGTLHAVLATGIGQTSIVNNVTPQEFVSAMMAIGMRA